MQHCMMFNAAGDDMVPGPDRTKDGQVIALRPPAGEDNLRWPAPDKTGNAGPSAFDCGASTLSFLVDGRSIAKLPHQKRTHSLQHLRQQRSSGIRIKVNSPHPYILREQRGPPSESIPAKDQNWLNG